MSIAEERKIKQGFYIGIANENLSMGENMVDLTI